MKKMKNVWKYSVLFMLLTFLAAGMNVFASGLSDDNSLSDLGLENALEVSPDFQYDITSYDIVVEEGTTELYLTPVTSNSAANYDISGTVIEDGKAHVSITVTAESGVQAVYTLDVTEQRPNAAAQIAAAAEDTEAVTEAPTEAATEAVQESETEAITEASEVSAVVSQKVNEQVAKLKEDTDFTMKVLYGLIAFCVVLLFFIINLLIKNRDLKDDLREAEEKLELQTNEFARKEQYMATENYYAPVQQQAAMGIQPEEEAPVLVAPQQVEAAPKVEAAFGAGEEKQPRHDVEKKPEKKAAKREEKKDVDVTMIDL